MSTMSLRHIIILSTTGATCSHAPPGNAPRRYGSVLAIWVDTLCCILRQKGNSVVSREEFAIPTLRTEFLFDSHGMAPGIASPSERPQSTICNIILGLMGLQGGILLPL